VRVAVDFVWRSVGVLRLDASKLRFPEVAEVPGVYRFDLGDRAYIGEADRLRRRFAHYRNPGPSQSTNIRLNTVMLDLLTGGGPIDVSVVTDATAVVDGRTVPLDLSHKAARLLVESAALTAERIAGRAFENL
jgi:hypothetical protein